MSIKEDGVPEDVEQLALVKPKVVAGDLDRK